MSRNLKHLRELAEQIAESALTNEHDTAAECGRTAEDADARAYKLRVDYAESNEEFNALTPKQRAKCLSYLASAFRASRMEPVL